MAYDYHGATFENHSFTGHHAPLYVSDVDTPDYVGFNVNHSINTWLRLGASPDKLVLGMGSYGRGFLLDFADQNGLYAPSHAAIPAGPYTREAGNWGYNEICEKMTAEPGQWTTVIDPSYQAPYSFKGLEWIGYDSIESITTKAAYARDLGLAGGMVWSVETDDFHGNCGQGAFPLINAIARTIRN